MSTTPAAPLRPEQEAALRYVREKGTEAPAASIRQRMAKTFAQLREGFDFVIVDLPPVNVYGDALIVGPHLDAAIIVIEADATRVPDVERARRARERAQEQMINPALGVDPAAALAAIQRAEARIEAAAQK